MLADQATAENGKLFILGGGWDRLSGNGPFSFTIAALAEIAIDSASVDIKGELRVMDPNGLVVKGVNGDPISNPLEIHATKPDAPAFSGWVQIPLIFRFDNLALAPGSYSIGLSLGEYASTKNFVVTAE
jgi:hypothetical protein